MGKIDHNNPRLSDFFGGESWFFQAITANTAIPSQPAEVPDFTGYYPRFVSLTETAGACAVVGPTPEMAWKFLLEFARQVRLGKIEGYSKTAKIFTIDYSLLRMASGQWEHHVGEGSPRPLVLVNRLDFLGPRHEWNNGLAHAIVFSAGNEIVDRHNQRAPMLVGTMERAALTSVLSLGGSSFSRRMRVFDLGET